MQVKLGLDLAGLRVDPCAAASHHESRRTDNLFQSRASFLRAPVAFSRQGKPSRNVVLPRAIFVIEHRQRWTEHDALGIIGSAASIVLGDIDQEFEATCKACRREPKQFVLALDKGATRHPPLGAGVAKQGVDEDFELTTVGLERAHLLPSRGGLSCVASKVRLAAHVLA